MVEAGFQSSPKVGRLIVGEALDGVRVLGICRSARGERVGLFSPAAIQKGVLQYNPTPRLELLLGVELTELLEDDRRRFLDEISQDLVAATEHPQAPRTWLITSERRCMASSCSEPEPSRIASIH